MSDAKPLHVRVHYDFASTLCYVAHRALARIRGPIEALGIELAWTPLDLTRLVGGRRAGAEIGESQRGNAARVAEELGVAVRVPRIWPDVRALGAAAAAQLARELALELSPAAIEDALDALERATERAREEQVTGVPTFMLGAWPFGGIQSDDTMLRVLARFARKARET